MAGFIPESTIEEIRGRSDIVELISSYIPLKKSGRNFKALCPFHHEKTPSFLVSPEKQIFHCFGCGVGGNVFNFVMKHDRLDFPEAARQLAVRVGVMIPEFSPGERRQASEVSQIVRANELALNYYRENLNHQRRGGACREYLSRRQIQPETIKEFRLGFATSAWEGLLTFARQKGLSEAILLKSGLVISRTEGGCYDRFRGRLIFPIVDLRQKVVGFGARVLDERTPKYINSPETGAYIKGRCLYGLGVTREYVRRQDEVVVVEGYLDLLSCYQAGIKNVAASSGTALTPDHARLVRRFTRNVVLIYDGDQAGEQATLRGLDVLIGEDLKVRIVSLPAGLDPDSFIRRKGGEALINLLSRAKPLFDYKLELLLNKFGAETIEDKIKIINEMLPTISRVKNAVLKSGFIKELAEKLGVKEEALLLELKKVKSGEYRSFSNLKIKETEQEVRGAEQILIGLMLINCEAISRVKERLRPEHFQDQRLRKIVDELFKLSSEDLPLRPDDLFNRLADEEAGGKLAEILISFPRPEDEEKMMEDCVAWIERDNLKLKLLDLGLRIENAQKADDRLHLEDLTRQYTRLIRSQKELAEKKG